MSIRKLYDNGETIYRVLAENEDELLVIDCIKRTMPFWIAKDALSGCKEIDEQTLYDKSGFSPLKEVVLSQQALSTAHLRYSLIAPVIAVAADKNKRNEMIAFAARNSGLSKQTIRQYLCLYLAFQTVTALASVSAVRCNELTKEHKLMRWALNKYFYTSRENSLRTAYLYLLKEKYLDKDGVLLRCIVHYNCKRKLTSVSYTSDMLANQVKPYPNELWNYGKTLPGANLISVDSEKLRMNLLPRTTGTFSRKGLTVNGLRYKRDGYTERFLKGGSCVVSYDPDNVSTVWLVEGGKYVEFELIESRFTSKSLEEVINIQHQVKELTTVNEDEQLQSEIDLQQHITAIGNTAKSINKRVTLGEESNV